VPASAAAPRVSMTLRGGTSSKSVAPASTTYCHGSVMARARSIAEPMMAPIAAGPAPPRNACMSGSARSRTRYLPCGLGGSRRGLLGSAQGDVFGS
jgi:hypothetical protein